MKKMTANEIRQKWIAFFVSKQHLEVPSKSLVPVNDPSLLWINSGIATLKKYFSGVENPPSKRLVNSQRAIRTNDITNVGVTARHHTFFEMLGNFSIGDYFKKESIAFAYELLIDHFNIDKNLLYITVFEEDKEAYDCWINLGIDQSHIIKGDKNRNFWDIGQGPCGPCTEIFYDRGEKYDFKKQGISLLKDDLENDRYVEIWNIVFSQFNNDGKNNYTELARKNIDTGAGLERIAAISQDVPTNFDTDIFMPIINEIEKHTNFKYDSQNYFKQDNEQTKINTNFKIIADHIKACVFAIADGVTPSNKDRGYIIRRLLRRSMVCARKLNINKSFMSSLTNTIICTMCDYYPYLNKETKHIIETLTNEETLFNKTLDRGFNLFNDVVKQNKLNDENVFQLVETYGFPFEIIVELAKEHGIYVNENTFLQKMEEHHDISRKGKKANGMSSQNNDLLSFVDESKFEYYKLTKKDCKIIACFNEDLTKTNHTTNKSWLAFDQTIFYATSGGQIHDGGYIKWHDNKFEIIDVIKAPNGQHLHLFDINGVKLNIGDSVDMYVDEQVRLRSSCNHSVEHLIQHALQQVIDKNIKQEGAFKSPEKVTFDFQHKTKLTAQQIKQLEDTVNKYIEQGLNVSTKLMTLEEAKKDGAIAWFEDVYSKIKGKLRVVAIGDVSKEICGGTHVNNTKDIEQFMIVSISNKGGNAWRLEGITHRDTINTYLTNEIHNLKQAIDKMHKDLSCNQINSQEFNNLFNSLNYQVSQENYEKLNNDFLALQKLYQQLMTDVFKIRSQEEVTNIKSIKKELSNSSQICYFTYKSENNKIINQAITELVNDDQEHAYVIINVGEKKIQYIIAASKNFVQKTNFNASDIVKELNHITQGSGGGRNEFAQGGTTNLQSLQQIINIIKNK